VLSSHLTELHLEPLAGFRHEPYFGLEPGDVGVRPVQFALGCAERILRRSDPRGTARDRARSAEARSLDSRSVAERSISRNWRCTGSRRCGAGATTDSACAYARLKARCTAARLPPVFPGAPPALQVLTVCRRRARGFRAYRQDDARFRAAAPCTWTRPLPLRGTHAAPRAWPR
jgi:hypothetical protein